MGTISELADSKRCEFGTFLAHTTMGDLGGRTEQQYILRSSTQGQHGKLDNQVSER